MGLAAQSCSTPKSRKEQKVSKHRVKRKHNKIQRKQSGRMIETLTTELRER